MVRSSLMICLLFTALASLPSVALAAVIAIKVVSDPSATYHLLRSSRLATGNLQVITRRQGRSGISFARREVNCSAMTFRYLGEGDTLAQALSNSRNQGRMTEAMSTSISGEVSRFACKRATK